MNITAIIIAFILYVIICCGNIKAKDYPHALIWGAYAISQLGFAWYEWSRDK